MNKVSEKLLPFYRRFDVGNTVRHFKWHNLTEEEKSEHKYEYQILHIGIDTTTNEPSVVYKSLAEDQTIWIRPMSEFCSLVDPIKYPSAVQSYRFQVIHL